MGGARTSHVPESAMEFKFAILAFGFVACCAVFLPMSKFTISRFLWSQIPLHLVAIPSITLWVMIQRCCPPFTVDDKYGFAFSQWCQFFSFVLCYASFTVPMMFWYKPYITPKEEADAAKKGGGYRSTQSYWNAAVMGCAEHVLYFIVFVSRQVNESSAAKDLNMRRALEQEFTFLVNSFVKPLFPSINHSLLLSAYLEGQDAMMNVVTGATLSHPDFGCEFWWYQMFEGINHGIIVVGSLLVIFPSYFDLKNQTISDLVLWLYEWAMIAELIVYGPQYFWILSGNLFSCIFANPHGLSTLEGKATLLAACCITTTHHIGYWIDTYSSWEICKAWGWDDIASDMSQLGSPPHKKKVAKAA